MQLITKEQTASLLANGAKSAKGDIDPYPKLTSSSPL